MTPMTRRKCLGSLAAVAFSPACLARESNPTKPSDLHLQLGVTTGSFNRHLSETRKPGKQRMLDLPKIMRDELGMKVIDLMTATLPSLEPGYCERLRTAAEDADCILTNLKMNQKELDLASADETLRKKSLDEYKRTIDAAERLGCRWVRPLPRSKRPEVIRYVSAYQELIDYAAPKGITLLIENFGWIASEPDVIPQVIKAVGQGLSASPDTGNWDNDVRYEGLAKAYPHAVTSDFKFFDLDESGHHKRYDLKRCFDIGWTAGFRGPWCFEHFHPELAQLLVEMRMMKERLENWIGETEDG